MPNATFFRRLGFLVIEDFFDTETCARLCAEANSVASTQATVVRTNSVVDETVRSTKLAAVSTSTIAFIEESLREVKPRIEAHFQMILTNHQEPQFLIYRTGDFFRVHQDGYRGDNVPEYLEKRRISVVIFLNNQAGEPGPDTYCGGALTLYGLIADPRCEKIGLPLLGTAGTFIAFPSKFAHEVEVVSRGNRYSIVSWFF